MRKWIIFKAIALASQLNQYQSRLQIRNGIEPFYPSAAAI